MSQYLGNWFVESIEYLDQAIIFNASFSCARNRIATYQKAFRLGQFGN